MSLHPLSIQQKFIFKNTESNPTPFIIDFDATEVRANKTIDDLMQSLRSCITLQPCFSIELVDVPLYQLPKLQTCEPKVSICVVGSFTDMKECEHVLFERALALIVEVTENQSKTLVRFVANPHSTDLYGLGRLINQWQLALTPGSVTSNFELDYLDYVYWQSDLKEQSEVAEVQLFWAKRALAMALQPRNSLAGVSVVKDFSANSKLLLLENDFASAVSKFCKSSRNTKHVFLANLLFALRPFLQSDQVSCRVQVDGRADETLSQMSGAFDIAVPWHVNVLQDTSVTMLVRQLDEEEELISDFFECLDIDEFLEVASGISMLNFSYIDLSDFDSEGIDIKKLANTVPPAQLNMTVVKLANTYALHVSSASLILTDNVQRKLCHQLALTVGYKFEAQMQPKHTIPTVFTNNDLLEKIFTEPTWEDNLALSDEDTLLSYKELRQQIALWQVYLSEQGVTRDDVVAIECHSCAVEVIVILATLSLGATYLPINVKLPDSQIAKLLLQSSAKLYISDTKATTLPPLVEIIKPQLLDANRAVLLQITVPRFEDNWSAYLIFTSGSTGEPKGVEVGYHQLCASTQARQDYYPSQPSAFLLSSPLYFDSSVAGLFWCLSSGGHLVLASQPILHEPSKVHALLCHHRISHMLTVPSYWQNLLNVFEDEENVHLNTVVVAGEPVAASLVQKHFEQLPNVALYNEYGPTEATVWSSVAQLLPQGGNINVTIGQAAPHSEVRIINESGQSANYGEIGEIYVGGFGVAKGYINESEERNSAFCRLFLGSNALWYKTGDFARWTLSDDIEFVGRKDEQVKHNGYRIELEAIVNTALELEHVEEASVLLEDGLLAFVAGTPDKLQEAQITEHFKANLPEYMVPNRLFILPTLPTNSNGKVDKKRLSEIASQIKLSEKAIAPKNAIEKSLLEIWNELLPSVQISTENDFFALGGNSITAVKAGFMMQQQNIPLLALDIIEHKTIVKLAVLVTQRQQSPQADNWHNNATSLTEQLAQLQLISEKAHTLLPAGVESAHVLPLTDIQSLMCKAYREDRERLGIYHSQQWLRLNGKLDISVVKQAWLDVLEQTSILRSIIITAQEQMYMALGAVSTGSIVQCIDLCHLKEDEQNSALEAARNADLDRPFDTSNGNTSLIRVYLYLLSTETLEIFVSNHHAILDGWSNQELFNRLNIALLDRDIPLTNFDLEDWQNHLALKMKMKVKEHNEEIEFWIQHVLPTAQLPNEMCVNGQDVKQGVVSTFNYTIPESHVEALQYYAKEHKISLKTMVAKAYTDALIAVSKLESITIGLVTNTRNSHLKDPMRAIGQYWNFLPMHIDSTQRSIVWYHEKLQKMAQNSDMSLSNITAQDGIFYATLNYIDFSESSNEADSVKNEKTIQVSHVGGHDKFHYPINLNVAVDGDGTLACRYEIMPNQVSSVAVEAVHLRLVEELSKWL